MRKADRKKYKRNSQIKTPEDIKGQARSVQLYYFSRDI